MKKSLVYFLVVHLLACNKINDITPDTKQEILTTAKGALIGSPVTKVIGNAGGNLALPSAGANIIVPPGAMLAGASLTMQATSNALGGGGQGVQISGDWQKPIWLEVSYGPEVTDPQNYRINYQTAKGDWIGSQRVKVDKNKRTIAVLLGQTGKGGNEQSSAKEIEHQQPIANGRKYRADGQQPAAGTYSFAASHEYYLKPDKSAIDLGESVTFTAYAKQGDTDGYWRKTKNGEYYYDDGELVPLTKSKSVINTNANPDDDDYCVPLTPISKTSSAADDDELVPLTKVIKEAAFANKKTGFTRSWILMQGPGELTPTGNSGAKYTAPKDASAKGKIAKISFLSKNDQTKQDLEASATVRIKDGLTRYTGTISINSIGRFYGGTGIFLGESEANWKADLDLVLYSDDKYTTTYISDKSNFRASCSNFYEIFYSASSGKEKERKTQNGASYGQGEDAGEIKIEIEKKTNKYTIRGWLETTGGNFSKRVLQDANKNTYSTENYISSSFTTPLYVDIADLIKPFDAKEAKAFSESIVAKWDGLTYNTTWNFKKVE